MPIEEQLLPSQDLKPLYDTVSWLYVCRLFDEQNPKDLEALRTHDRFGISSWPQLLLFDPVDDRVLSAVPRTLPEFMRTLESVARSFEPAVPKSRAGVRIAEQVAEARALGRGAKARAMLEELAAREDPYEGWLEARELLREWRFVQPGPALERLDDPDPRERALALEELARSGAKQKQKQAVTRAVELMLAGDEGVVVRLRALRFVRRAAPEEVARHAHELLAVPNDPWRYEVLEVLGETPNPQLGAALAELFENAERSSRNPNVLRIKLAGCLAKSGDGRAIPALAVPAREADPNNGLTRAVLGALAAIGARGSAKDKRAVLEVLADSLPAAVAADADAAQQRRATGLARDVVDAFCRVRGKDGPSIPSSWTDRDRAAVATQLDRLAR